VKVKRGVSVPLKDEGRGDKERGRVERTEEERKWDEGPSGEVEVIETVITETLKLSLSCLLQRRKRDQKRGNEMVSVL
jgi:hypothetical protein